MINEPVDFHCRLNKNNIKTQVMQMWQTVTDIFDTSNIQTYLNSINIYSYFTIAHKW